jgi:hypothetical protein
LLQVSDSALVLLKDALAQERTEETHVFRLQVRDDQFVLGIDDVQADDVQFEVEGETVLAAPEEIATTLLGATTIDLETTDEGPKLVLVT